MPTSKKRISFYAEPAIEALLADQVALGYPLSGVIRAALLTAYNPRYKGVALPTRTEPDARGVVTRQPVLFALEQETR